MLETVTCAEAAKLPNPQRGNNKRISTSPLNPPKGDFVVWFDNCVFIIVIV
jgi:hypothetical protein